MRRALPLLAPLFAAIPALHAQDPSPLDRVLDDVQRRVERDTEILEERTTWETAWVARSEHYEVRSLHSYGLAKQIADGQETMLEHFQRVLGKGIQRSEPFVIHVRRDVGAYNQAGEEFGTEHSSFYGSYFAEQEERTPVEVAWDRNTTWLQIQITHSALHQFLKTAHPGARMPAWVEEGLAAYFSFYWDQAWAIAELQRMRTDDEVLGFRQLAATNLSSFGRDTHARMVQLGMLFSWLMDYREDTRIQHDADGAVTGGRFLEVLRKLCNGEGEFAALNFITELGGPIDLMKDFTAYEFPAK